MTLIDLANPTRFLAFTARLLPWLVAATFILLAVGLYQSAMAPDDYQQGATVKIMFIHVPNAWLSMFVWGVMSLAALGTLVWRHPLADVAYAVERGFVYDGKYSPHRGRNHGRPLADVGDDGDGHGEQLGRLLGYIQTHDQIGNRACGERISHLVDVDTAMIGAALVLLSPFEMTEPLVRLPGQSISSVGTVLLLLFGAWGASLLIAGRLPTIDTPLSRPWPRPWPIRWPPA